MTITYRTIKGSELTYAEVDENFATITAQYDAVAAAVGDVNKSAANAANSAASAAASEKSAFNSAESAKASQVAVTDLYDQFDDRYLGSKDAAPTLDNDGNALLTGALYWNSVSNKMFVWTGSMWADVVAANASTVQFSPTGGISATNVQAAIAEVDSEKLAITTYESRAGSQGAISGDRNRVINGSCQIVNVATAVITTASGALYGGPEMFIASMTSGAGGQFTQSQQSLSFGGLTLPTVRQTVDTANTNIGTTNFWTGIQYRFEGFNVFDLRGKSVALSFVFNSNVSGTYSVAVQDGAAGQSYVTTVTAVANTPQKVSIPVAAIPSGASLPNTNALGLIVSVGNLNTGNFQTSTLNAWQSGNFQSASGATNWGAAAGNFIELTNLQLEEGTVATPFIRRSYQQELALTQRYYYLIDPDAAAKPLGVGFNESTTVARSYSPFPVLMRTTPTTLNQTGSAADYQVQHGAVTTECSAVPTLQAAMPYGAVVSFTVASGLTVGQGSMCRAVNTSGYLGFSARL